MTAQSIDTVKRHGRRTVARQRLPRDLILLILFVMALYLAARLLAPEREPKTPPPPAPAESSAPVSALPPPPMLEAAPAPLPHRQPRAPAQPAAPEITAHDPFAGLEPLSAQELDSISQAH
jgi:hypothetical protein